MVIKEYIIKIDEDQNKKDIHGGYPLIEPPLELIRCKDCKYRSFYCTEATDGTTLYECHHPCANSVPRPGDWYCADGKRKNS